MDNISDWLYILVIAGGIISTLLPKRQKKQEEPLPEEEVSDWDFEPQETVFTLPPSAQPLQRGKRKKQETASPPQYRKSTTEPTPSPSVLETTETGAHSITPKNEEEWKRAFIGSEIFSPKYKEYH